MSIFHIFILLFLTPGVLLFFLTLSLTCCFFLSRAPNYFSAGEPPASSSEPLQNDLCKPCIYMLVMHVMSLPIYFQWGHTQSCCWSTQWESTWCPPEHTLPERKLQDIERQELRGKLCFKTVDFIYSQPYSDYRSSLFVSIKQNPITQHIAGVKRQGRQNMKCDMRWRIYKSNTFHCSYLLSLQSQFNKDLLQFLVDKVDTELLKAIFLPGENIIQSMSDYHHSKSNPAVLYHL